MWLHFYKFPLLWTKIINQLEKLYDSYVIPFPFLFIYS